jgi:hypothetical protein
MEYMKKENVKLYVERMDQKDNKSWTKWNELIFD